MPPIKSLPENVWSRIAAGEVVERPASAVKELTENSLDAGAKRITVSLKDGGRLRITVEDDGSGIAFDDLPLALAYHATSKLREVSDLERISTLGYRGEALASLSAVADVEIRSRQAGDNEGGLVRTHDGKITEHVRAKCSLGTRVQIDNLFSGLPARRKFLKSASGELRRAAVFLREYSVCNPSVSFRLEHDGKEIFSTDGSGDRRRVLSKIWPEGAEIQTANIQAEHLNLECWFQSRAGLSGRGDVMSFVNGRAVNDPVIKSAVATAARELAGNWALFFTLEPSLVDVNIHPAKAEVRFRYPDEIYSSVRNAVKRLGSPMFIPEIAEKSVTAPPKITPSPKFQPSPSRSGWNFRDTPSKFTGSGNYSRDKVRQIDIFQAIPKLKRLFPK
ncbi:MAG: ATP-binding protein [Synergistaceae bacterium]|nr:ATP-binding protein [Synergistaceae bacterium]